MSLTDAANSRELIQRFAKAAELELAAIHTADPLTHDDFARHLLAFILDKFLLLPEDIPEGRMFTRIAETSLAKSAGISRELVREFDQAKSCSGTSSVMAKKVLLFLKLQREFGIELPAEDSARVGTIDDLIELVWRTVLSTPSSTLSRQILTGA